MAVNYHNKHYIKRPYQMNDQLPEGTVDTAPKKPAISWTLKSIAGSPKSLFYSQLSIVLATILMLSYVIYIFWEIFKEDHGFFLAMVLCCLATGFYLLAGIRQKTNYRYKIYETRAKLVYHLHSPKHVKIFCKGAAFLSIFLLLLMGLMSGSLLFMIGPGGIALLAAIRLLTWKTPIKRETSLPWHEYNFVTLDRKRRFIVIHKTDLTLGFEARLPNDELFEEYLAFLHRVLPATAQFTEKKWDMSLI